jgi:hypothetical protein
MYAALWRILPGRRPVKALLSLVLVIVVIAVCFLWLFPAIAPLMPFNDNSVQTGLPPAGATSAAMGVSPR